MIGWSPFDLLKVCYYPDVKITCVCTKGDSYFLVGEEYNLTHEELKRLSAGLRFQPRQLLARDWGRLMRLTVNAEELKFRANGTTDPCKRGKDIELSSLDWADLSSLYTLVEPSKTITYEGRYCYSSRPGELVKILLIDPKLKAGTVLAIGPREDSLVTYHNAEGESSNPNLNLVPYTDPVSKAWSELDHTKVTSEYEYFRLGWERSCLKE